MTGFRFCRMVSGVEGRGPWFQRFMTENKSGRSGERPFLFLSDEWSLFRLLIDRFANGRKNLALSADHARCMKQRFIAALEG